MRCTHCFFTEELDDRPRKKLQMKTDEIEKISETLGGNLGVLVLAGGEPFTRKDLPEIVRSFYENNKLDSVYLMSNGQIHPRIFPDVSRIMEECPNLNVTVALGIDGIKERARKDSSERGKLGQSDSHGAHFAADETRAVSETRHSNLYLCDEFQSGHDF